MPTVVESTAIIVEFFGMARRMTGCPDTRLNAATLGEALTRTTEAYPVLAECLGDGDFSSHFLVSINGGPFQTDAQTRLSAGDRVLLLPIDAGG